jgi:hypothetical protein
VGGVPGVVARRRLARSPVRVVVQAVKGQQVQTTSLQQESIRFLLWQHRANNDEQQTNCCLKKC